MSNSPLQSLDPYINHLEFLGYTIKPLDAEKKVMGAAHTTRRNLVFRAFRVGVFFSISYKSRPEVKGDELGILQLANLFNTRYVICRVYVDKDKDLIIEAYYAREYDKTAFGVFIDDLENDVAGAFRTAAEQSAKILI